MTLPSSKSQFAVVVVAGAAFLFCLIGCSYEGPLSGVSCEADDECPYSTPCVEGWCDLEFSSEQPHLDASTGDVSQNPGCSSNQLLCDGDCIDPKDDSENCGACGRNCRSGTCSDGECEFGCETGQTPFGGGTGTEEDPYVICTAAHLGNVGGDDHAHLNSDFVLANDIHLEHFDMTEFSLIGYYEDDDINQPFKGHFEGYGRAIRKLAMNAYEPGVGGDDSGSTLFGFIGPEGGIENIRLIEVDMRGDDFVSGLVGLNSGVIRNCEVTGEINGDGEMIGGIAVANRGLITDCTAQVKVQGGELVGGAVGANDGTISRIEVDGEIVGSGGRVGGLVGRNRDSISASRAQGQVAASHDVGGLVGQNQEEGIVLHSHADMMVSAIDERSGGLVGDNQETAEISDSYASGPVEGYGSVGGFVGRNRGEVRFSYSFGSAAVNYPGSNAIAEGTIGGLVGDTGGQVQSSFWNSVANSEIESSDDHNSEHGKSMTPTEFGYAPNFIGWDFQDIWQISTRDSRPQLRWEDTD